MRRAAGRDRDTFRVLLTPTENPVTNQPLHLNDQDIVVGIDLASTSHSVVILDRNGRRLTRFNVPHSREGITEVLRRSRPTMWGRGSGRVFFAFEATGHVWESVAQALEDAGAEYRIVNPLATFRLREAKQLDRDKRDITDAEQIADLLRTGYVTETQLNPRRYVELRRLWGEYSRLRSERARLKTLVKHQLYGAFPELVRVWKDIFCPGALAVLRLGLTPADIAQLTVTDFCARAKEAARGRRCWKPKLVQVHRWASKSVGGRSSAQALTDEIRRITVRVDLLTEQLDELSAVIQERLRGFEEATYLETLPGTSWVTVAGILAQVGPIDRYRSARQLIKLAGINPGRRETGRSAGRTPMTRRGRAELRTVVYMATISSIQHNPRIKAHYERLIQRTDRPLTKMAAVGACMTKFLHLAFAVMKHRRAFDRDHQWRDAACAA